MRYKIVDGWFGGNGGEKFFGLADETRDMRRFDTVQAAQEQIRRDERNAAANARRVMLRPLEDVFGRRFMNLTVVPEDHVWCKRSDEEHWRWQQPEEFDFGQPFEEGKGRITYFVLGLGRVEGSEYDRWIAEKDGIIIRDNCVSPYEAAHVLHIASLGADSDALQQR